MRISQGAVIGMTAVATAGTVANAFLINKQFYPTMVYLTKSNGSLAVIYVQSLVLVYLMFQLVRRIFFGDLRASESEHLSERAWHAVMETCLAFTVFRDDFSPWFVMQFVLLLFIKSLHWLADDRVDLMERSPVITIKFHIRILSIAGCLAALDSFFVSHSYFAVEQKGPSAHVVFGFEYAILITMVLQVVIKYLLHMFDLRSPTPWESKSLYLLHAELFINFIRCILYLLFMIIMLRIHTLPLFSIRPFYIALRSFHKALNDVILSRRAVHAMNHLFPIVGDDELAAMDATCIICREEMTSASQPKRLPCSHVFHAHCLTTWFQRQQTCPTCRTDILRTDHRRQGGAQGGVAAAVRAAAQGAQGGAGVGANGAQGGQIRNGPPLPPHIWIANQVFGQFGVPPPHIGVQPQQGAEGQQPQGVPQPPPIPPNLNQFLFPPLPPLPGLGGGLPFPPFPPIPPPFTFPTPPSTSGLTDDELRQLEGNTRSALEARIRVLGDISALLDAAVLQMQQYSSMVPPIPTVIPTTVPSPSQPPSTSNAPPPPPTTTSSPSSSSSSEPSSSSNGSSVNEVSSSIGDTINRDTNESINGQNGNEEEQRGDEDEREREQVRLRRLQRLGEL